MNLVVPPPVLPMLAKRVDELPEGDGWIFEPKWDGFRALVFRDGDEIFIQSRDEKPLDRYFPELACPAEAPSCRALRARRRDRHRARGSALDFEALQLRLHPAASRVKLLASEIPASVVFFDLLCEGERDLAATPFAERRARAGEAARRRGAAAAPHAGDPTIAARPRDWFRRFEGAGLDGVMAKPEPASTSRTSA